MGCFSKDVSIFQTSLYLFLITPLVASCASNQLGPSRPISIDNDVALMWPLAYPDLTAFYNSSPAVQASERNQILTARMFIADMEYNTYEARLTREMQDEGILATAVNLGLTTSATLVPLAQTKTLLSGIATGVTGLDKAYDEKELLSSTIQALQTQMRADRKTRAAVIYAKMFKDAGNNTKTITPIAEYTLPMALSDTDAYYQAGTIASSLIGLSKTVANSETNADQAKAAKGPNPAAVMDANTTAAPLTPNMVRQTIQHQVIREATAPIPAPFILRPVNTGDTRIGRFEQSLQQSDIESYQKLVCVKQNGKLGDRGSATRQEIHKYLVKLGAKAENEDTDKITLRDDIIMRRQIRAGKSACAE